MKKIMILLCCLCVPFLYSCPYVQIAETGVIVGKGVTWGMDYVSYFAATNTSLENINAALIKAGKKINLDDTYRLIYGKSLKDAGPKGDTGQKFEHMRDVTLPFQKILTAKGLPNAGNYILAANNSQKGNGYILFAVVFRPYSTIKVIDKYDKSTIRVLTSEDIKFYAPFKKDANGNNLDKVIDWAGIPVKTASQQKYQAVMLTLAANQVFEEETREDYWEAERRWIAGEYGAACLEQDKKTCHIMGIRMGFNE